MTGGVETKLIPGEAGTAEELERLFRESAPVVWRAVYAFTAGRREIADEAVSEAFARALQRISSIRKPLPWIYRTALRIAGAEMRRESRRPPVADQIPPHQGGELEELMSAMKRLSPNQRAAIVLHYQADFPVREVSRLLGMAPATVKVHLHRGRRRLRALLGTEENDG